MGVSLITEMPVQKYFFKGQQSPYQDFVVEADDGGHAIERARAVARDHGWLLDEPISPRELGKDEATTTASFNNGHFIVHRARLNVR
jgi:hypothetical protein